MKTKEITYEERSMFYDNEYVKKKYICLYLKYLANQYKFTSTICCPCGTGIYFEEFSNYFKSNYFIDINCEMIKKLLEKLKVNKFTNVIPLVYDMKKIKKLRISVDCFVSLDQGIQFLSIDEFKLFLKNIKETAEYIVLDLFDFNVDGKLEYYDSGFEDNIEYFSKKIKYNDKILKRYNVQHHKKDRIIIDYKYVIENNAIFTSQIQLFNYPYEVIKDVIVKGKIYKIVEMKKYNQGNYIILLKRSDDIESKE